MEISSTTCGATYFLKAETTFLLLKISVIYPYAKKYTNVTINMIGKTMRFITFPLLYNTNPAAKFAPMAKTITTADTAT